MKVSKAGFLAIAALASLGAASQPAYQEGQVWEYRTRPVDAGSLLRIQKIEHLEASGKDEQVYHLSVVGLQLPDTPDKGGVLQHIPVSRGTLDASVTKLSSRNPDFPDPTAGIAEWRRAQGGVFTIPMAEIVASVEMMLSRSEPQQPVS